MTRPEHLRVSGYLIWEVNELLDAICEVGTKVTIHWHWRPQLHDPDDEMVLETAINGYADVIVTFNRTHFVQAGKQFGFQTLSPRETLERVVNQ